LNSKLNIEIQKIAIKFVISGITLLFVTIIFSILWNHSIKNVLAIQAAGFIRKGIASSDLRGVVEYLNGVQFSTFESVVLSNGDGKQIIALPPTMDQKNYKNNFFRYLIFGEIKSEIYLANNDQIPIAIITFIYRRVELVLYAIIAWLLALAPLVYLFKSAKIKVQVEFERQLKVKNIETAHNIARQVAHDIRSPLSALTMLSDAFNSVPEEKRLIIRGAIQRINDIANDLLQKSKENPAEFDKEALKKEQTENPADNFVETETYAHKTKTELLPAVVDLIISEKRIQYRDKMNIEIISDFSNSYSDFAEINANELKRALSNLINNSIEAFSEQKGKIMISIQSNKTTVSVVVRDNGQGIPPHILAKLGEKGISHGKEGTTSGSGLGVYHAKQSTESVNGKFEILSKVGLGTTITMSFPKAPPPNWFVEKLTLKTNMQLVSLDDDLSIHQIWKGRLQSLNSESFGISLLSFTSGNEFENYIKTQVNDTVQKIFLVDYELLNQNMTGLDLIEKLDLGAKAILVTSRYEEEHIRSRCAKLGVRLIPKGMAGFVPIEIKKPKQKYDAILIDDDDLVHMTWQIVAKEKNKLIKLFKTEAEFLAVANEIDPLTPLYVDVHLGEKVNGIEVAKRIHELGFNKIYLATGYAEIEKPGFIEAVVGKDPQL